MDASNGYITLNALNDNKSHTSNSYNCKFYTIYTYFRYNLQKRVGNQMCAQLFPLLPTPVLVRAKTLFFQVIVIRMSGFHRGRSCFNEIKKKKGSETEPQTGLKKMTGVWKRVTRQLMENLPLEHGKGCFSSLFSLLVSKSEHEAAGPAAVGMPPAHLGGAARDGAERGARGGSDPAPGAERGGGGGRRREEGRGGRNCPRGPSPHPPALPFTGANRVPSPARYAPAPAPRRTDRETETPDKGWGFGGK